MAATLRILLHDGRQGQSLLRQMNLQDARFFDTAPKVNPANLLPTFGLVMVAFGAEFRFVAPLAMEREHGVMMLPFDVWWKKVVVNIPDQFALTRRDLVLLMADQDGGAHVDPEIDERYYRLTRENALGFTVETQIGRQPLTGIETASIRQIANEVRCSLLTPWPTVPPDMPESEPTEMVVITTDPVTGIATSRTLKRRPVCPCDSGLSYAECHKRGGVNEGK